MVKRQDASTGQIVDDGRPADGTNPEDIAAQALSKDEPELVDGKPVIHVKIYSPFHIYYDDKSYSLSAENPTGPFDVLPRHHNFISLLNACELKVRAPVGDKRIKISGGLLQVHNNVVKVFLDV